MSTPSSSVLVQPTLLFCCGVLACLAWRTGLYANAVVIGLIAMAFVMGGWWRARHQSAAQFPTYPDAHVVLTLQAEQRRLRAMLDQAPVPLVTLSADGTMRAVNKAARTLFACDDRLIAPPEGLREIIGDHASGEVTVVTLSNGLNAAARRRYALSVATSITAEGICRLAVLTDVQAELLTSEARTLRDLLQVLGHEIMNSLTPVTSLAESAGALLARGRPIDLLQVAQALETIGRRAAGLDRFVAGYRTLARLPDPVLRPVAVSGLLRDAATLFDNRWKSLGVLLTLQLPTPDVIARVDPDMVGQALLNLLANAAEAAVAAADRPPCVTLSAFLVGAGVAFRITDNGIGVSEGQEEAIFQPFVTLRAGGTGIGLGLARQIALMHGGTLTLETPTTGEGASFLLSL